jgi:hypothetical protein
VGWGITLIYIGLMLFYIYDDPFSLPLHNPIKIGSFISDYITPLILVWAIVGYTIQEKTSRKTLEIIEQEKNDREKSSLARFSFRNSYINKVNPEDDLKDLKISLELLNYGEEAKKIHLKIIHHSEEIKTKCIHNLDKKEKKTFVFYHEKELKSPFSVRLRYIDLIGKKREQIYHFEISEYLDDDSDLRIITTKSSPDSEIEIKS